MVDRKLKLHQFSVYEIIFGFPYLLNLSDVTIAECLWLHGVIKRKITSGGSRGRVALSPGPIFILKLAGGKGLVVMDKVFVCMH